jgi:hypothetical protein
MRTLASHERAMSSVSDRLSRIAHRKAQSRAVTALMSRKFPKLRVYVLTVLGATL